ncbi:dockerin type I domain-containing protein [Ruminococcus sp.]|uniref:dockerin type I domain-containing protein n=1 Tax=Ruminococcus sp. TaxID=41978 RepID=UPI0025DA6010|nr:dockerin type I domain-containing protein [Ruminococcus sp.]
MRSKRLLAAAVSFALAAGQLSVGAFADSTDNKGEQKDTSAAADVSEKDDEVTTGDDDTTDAETTAEYDIGDVNGDGDINVTDLMKVAAYVKNIKGLEKKELAAADINADDDINVTDVNLLGAHVKGIRDINYYTDLPVVKNPRAKQTNVKYIEFNVDKNTKTVSWNAVSGMEKYLVEFTDGKENKSLTTTGTSVNIPYDLFRDGKLKITITPVRLVKTEEGDRVNDYGDSTGYELKIKPGDLTGAIKVDCEDDGRLTATWDEVDLVSGYHIYDLSRTAEDGKLYLLTDVHSASFTTASVVTGTLKLMAVPYNSVGEGQGMEFIMIGGKEPTPTPTPTPEPTPTPTPTPTPEPEPAPISNGLPAPTYDLGNFYYSDNNSVTVYWNAVSGAQGYHVYTTVGGKLVESYVTGTQCTLGNLPQRSVIKVLIRAYQKDMNGNFTYGNEAVMKPVTDGLIKCVTGTYIYAETSTSSAQLRWVNAGDILTQTDIPGGGWTRVFVPGGGGTLRGYVPTANFGNYSDSGLMVINQDGWLGGSPAVLGCEETSLASVMNYQFGINVSKNTLIDYYMPEKAFVNGTIDVDPNYCFWGSPYRMEGSVGYGCYAPVVAQSANQYMKYIGVRDNYTINLYTDYYTGENVNKTKFDPSKLDLGNTQISGGLDLDGLKAELDKGLNPIIWYSEIEPYAVCTQTLKEGGQYTNPGSGTYNFVWYGRQHTTVLVGYDDTTDQFILANVENFDGSNNGVVERVSYDFFMKTYNALGRQAVVLSKNV